MRAEIEIDIVDINESIIKDIPEPCRKCVYWEFPEDFEKEISNEDSRKRDAELEVKKKEWFEHVMKEFGTCGKIVFYDDQPVGYAQYAPSTCLPNISAYESKPVGKLEEGVVFLSCLYVTDPMLRGRGIGTKLLLNIIETLRRKGFRAIETFARRDQADNPSGPIAFYVKNGFHMKDRTNPDFPLMRMYL
jgi:GNAT superfamily N-acetyltransferase